MASCPKANSTVVLLHDSYFWKGVKASSPLWVGILPFGLITGATAVENGMPLGAALSMSWILFAGASQLTMLTLLQQDVPIFVLIATVLVVNLRFVMYSATIAPHFQELSSARKSLFSYLLTDQGFLLALPELARPGNRRNGANFYFGISIALWVLWQLSCAAGGVLGQGLPPSWALDFAVPLSFIALLVPSLKTKPAVAASLTSAIAMLWAHLLPLHLGIIAASLLGVLVGVLCEMRL